jgi:hypothetical protein
VSGTSIDPALLKSGLKLFNQAEAIVGLDDAALLPQAGALRAFSSTVVLTCSS